MIVATPAISIIDVETKKSLGGVAFDRTDNSGFKRGTARLNLDGKSIMFVEPGMLGMYDLASGNRLAQHELPKGISTSRIGQLGMELLSANQMLVNGRSIFDFRLGLEVGSIEMGYSNNVRYFANATRVLGKVDDAGGGVGGFGGAIGGAKSRGSFGFDEKTNYVDSQAVVRLERLPVDEIVRFADSITEDDIVDFGDGDSVQLVFDLGKESGLEGQIREKVTKIMGENNVSIVDSSDYTLEFVYKVGEPQTETYRIIGGPTVETRTVNFTPKTCTASLKYQGNRIWSSGASASLGRPFSEEELDNTIANGNKVNARKLLEFTYPNQVRVIDPRKKREFRWQ